MYMYDLDTHTCTQDKVEVYKHKFRTGVKNTMHTDFRAKYKNFYDDEKKKILDEVEDENLKERLRISLPSYMNLRSASYKARCVPTAPKELSEIDLSILENENLAISDYLLNSSPEDGIYIYGLLALLKEFSNSTFKSCDGTFKICPKLFYQVFLT